MHMVCVIFVCVATLDPPIQVLPEKHRKDGKFCEKDSSFIEIAQPEAQFVFEIVEDFCRGRR